MKERKEKAYRQFGELGRPGAADDAAGWAGGDLDDGRDDDDLDLVVPQSSKRARRRRRGPPVLDPGSIHWNRELLQGALMNQVVDPAMTQEGENADRRAAELAVQSSRDSPTEISFSDDGTHTGLHADIMGKMAVDSPMGVSADDSGLLTSWNSSGFAMEWEWARGRPRARDLFHAS